MYIVLFAHMYKKTSFFEQRALVFFNTRGKGSAKITWFCNKIFKNMTTNTIIIPAARRS